MSSKETEWTEAAHLATAAHARVPYNTILPLSVRGLREIYAGKMLDLCWFSRRIVWNDPLQEKFIEIINVQEVHVQRFQRRYHQL